MSGQNYYQILGIPRDATQDEIRDAYFDLARQYHPDANPDPEVREQFLLIQEAHETLSNTERKGRYDRRLPPAPKPPEIMMNVRFSRTIVPWLVEQQLLYAYVEMVCTAEQERMIYPPIHLNLIVDRSTSMQGDRIDMVKKNILQCAKLLKPGDTISVVTFSDRAQLLVPPTHVEDLEKFEQRIRLIATGGGTEIFSGLKLGIEQFSDEKDTRLVRQAIILTDGHTYGDEKACLELAERANRAGIAISAFGIGEEWNDTFLDRLTGLCGGNTVYVTSAKDLASFMEQKLRLLSSVYARNLMFLFESSPNIELKYAFRVNPDIGPMPLSSPLSLGDLPFGKSLVFLLEFVVPGFTEDVQTITLAEGRITMEIPTNEEMKARKFVKLTREVRPNPEAELIPPTIVEAMSHLSLYRLQERAKAEVEAGDIKQATRHLHYLATHLLSLGNQSLAHDVLVEADHLQQNRQFSPEGDKHIKYGTRALLLPSGLEDIRQ